MILRELADLARREKLFEIEGDPENTDFEVEEVRWIVNLGPGGRYLEVEETQGKLDKKGKTRPRVYLVPRSVVRTSGSVANFLVDKPEYALGFDPDLSARKQAKLAIHFDLFRQHVADARKLAADDEGLQALDEFLGRKAEVDKAIDRLRDVAVANDLIAFRYHGSDDADLIHLRPKVRAAWGALRIPKNPPVPCIVCGRESPPIDVHPQVKRVPGGTPSGVAIVSANTSAFESLGLPKTSGAPVCLKCADAYGTALNRLFHPQFMTPAGKDLQPRMFPISDDTALIYWVCSPEESKFVARLNQMQAPDAAQEVYNFLWDAKKGNQVLFNDPAPFHGLFVTGGQGRATLRGYFHSTIGEVARNVYTYFEDIKIVPRFANSPPFPSTTRLVNSLAVLTKRENVKAALGCDIHLAIFEGRPFPREVLAASVGRIRIEKEGSRGGKVSQERVALIRATLNRWFDRDQHIKDLLKRKVDFMLDATYDNTAYCLGRLLAVLERVQVVALGVRNTSITDRFYGAASATPAVVFPELLRKAHHHLAKLRRRRSVRYQKLIQSILDLLPAGRLPSTMPLEEQGLFALGFYHQRADLSKKPMPDDEPKPDDAPPEAEPKSAE